MDVNAEVLKTGMTVRLALAEATTFVQPDHAHEAAPLVAPTLRRFEAVRDKILRIQDRVNPTTFLNALSEFGSILRVHARLSVAGRAVNHKLLVKDLTKLHNGEDGLDGVLRFLPGADRSVDVVPWDEREAFETAKTKYEEAVDKAIDECFKTYSSNLKTHAGKIRELMAVLTEAEASKDPAKWSENNLSKKVKRLFTELVKEAQEFEQAAELPRWFISLDRIDYLSEPFAKGSFGSVHHGTWGSGTKVVIKRMLLENGSYISEKMLEAFKKEADLWSQLKHPYVSRLFGACHTSAPPIMVCEAAKSGNLRNYLTEEVGKKRFWRLLYQTALGIEYLHEKNIIHGDLKLDNVLVGDDGYARVTDFGLARLKESSSVYATAAELEIQSAGALRWRAPECVDEHGAKPQLPADVYSLGLCIFEAFEGAAPYHYLDDTSAKNQIRAGKLPTWPASMPEDVQKLVTDMTKLKPEDRLKIHDAVVAIYKYVAEEEKAEWAGIFVCVVCGTEVPSHVNKRCSKCLKIVEVRQKDGSEAFTIRNKDDLPRVMEMLSSQADPQKISATGALKTYVFGDPTHQKEVSDASGISVMTQIVKRSNQDPAVQRESLVTLGCVVVGNTVGQGDAKFEEVIPRLGQLVNGANPLKIKSAMVLGYMAYGNKTNLDDILAIENVLANIKDLESGSLEEKRAAKKALAILHPEPPTAQAA